MNGDRNNNRNIVLKKRKEITNDWNGLCYKFCLFWDKPHLENTDTLWFGNSGNIYPSYS
jgi:hypothetical protein